MGTSGRDMPPAKMRSFQDMTLNDNWYEDRLYRPEGLPWDEARQQRAARQKEEAITAAAEGHDRCVQSLPTLTTLTRQPRPPTTRTMAIDCPNEDDPFKRDFITMKMEAESHLSERLQPSPIRKLVNHHNVNQATEPERNTSAPKTGFGSTIPRHPPADFMGSWQTTAQHFYEEKPRASPLARPTGSIHPRKLALTKGVWETSTNEPGTGRLGARGEFTRQPREAGSVYGYSTWADEYNKWGQALKGQSLAYTVANMKTKYF